MSMQLGICTSAVVVWIMAIHAQLITLSQSTRFVYECIVVLTFKKSLMFSTYILVKGRHVLTRKALLGSEILSVVGAVDRTLADF